MKKLFTIIVGLIIAILLISEINSYNNSKYIAEKRICSFNIDKIYKAVEIYLMGNSKIPETITIKQLIEKKYIKKIPVCPANGGYLIKILKNDNNFNIKINCSIHKVDKITN